MSIFNYTSLADDACGHYSSEDWELMFPDVKPEEFNKWTELDDRVCVLNLSQGFFQIVRFLVFCEFFNIINKTLFSRWDMLSLY